ncbi:MAG: hypothetical protein M3403_06105 [Gemmatimonadota bacterium]|nr:hypothetical protein [Gemmatimonadota bacterium]
MLILLTGLLAPSLAQPVLIGRTVAVSVILLAYSYIIWKRDPESRGGPSRA